MITPATIDNTRFEGFVVKRKNEGNIGDNRVSLWSVYNPDGIFLTQWLIVQSADHDEDIRKLNEIAVRVALQNYRGFCRTQNHRK